MLAIKKIDHVGIRVRQRDRAVNFYAELGFRLMYEGTFAKGHPVIMEHPGGVVINLLGPADPQEGPNILMDIEAKHAGYTHMALRVDSLADAREFMTTRDIAITGQINFGSLRAFFVRDPDGNVIEFDEYPGDEPSTRAD